MSHIRYLSEKTPTYPASKLYRPARGRQGQPWLARPLSRRRLLRTVAGATGAALTAGSFGTAFAHSGTHDASGAPTPIPGGFEFGGEFLHVFLPNSGFEEATIFNFNGSLGSVLARGQGTGTEADGTTTRYGFHVDMRLMEGVYIGVDGKQHRDTFAFV